MKESCSLPPQVPSTLTVPLNCWPPAASLAASSGVRSVPVPVVTVVADVSVAPVVAAVGCSAGAAVGCSAGAAVGCSAGAAVGCSAGAALGCPAAVVAEDVGVLVPPQAARSAPN